MYTKTKKKLDELKNKNEMVFRAAVSHLLNVGIQNLSQEIVNATCKEIMKQDDSHSIISNVIQCEIVKTASELAKINKIHLMNYIANEVYKLNEENVEEKI